MQHCTLHNKGMLGAFKLRPQLVLQSIATFLPYQALFFSSAPTVVSGTTRVHIPRDRVSASFSRSSGAGGQNVNKVSTKADVRFHLASATWLSEEVKGRLAGLYPNHVNAEGEVFVTSQKHRTQESNLEDAMEKLGRMVEKAALVPKVRLLRTNLSELTKNVYREDKRHRAEVKKHRAPPRDPFD